MNASLMIRPLYPVLLRYMSRSERLAAPFVLVLCCICALTLTCSTSLGQSSQPASSVPSTDIVISGMKHGREKLQSGSFTASGRIVEKWRDTNRDLPWNVHCAFDASQDVLRFDQRLPLHVTDGSLKVHEVKYYRTPTKAVVWERGIQGPYLFISEPQVQLSTMLRTFDVRSVGLGLVWTYEGGVSFQKVLDDFSQMEHISVAEDSPNVFRIVSTWKSPTDDVQILQSTWCDASRDYAPIRIDQRHAKKSTVLPFDLAVWPDHKAISSQTSFEPRAGVWCPKAMRLENDAYVYELQFDWQSVNSGVPDDIVSERGMKLDMSTPVYDHRVSPQVFLGVLSDYLRGGKPSAKTVKVDSSWRWLIPAAVLALICAVLIGVISRVWRVLAR